MSFRIMHKNLSNHFPFWMLYKILRIYHLPLFITIISIYREKAVEVEHFGGCMQVREWSIKIYNNLQLALGSQQLKMIYFMM